MPEEYRYHFVDLVAIIQDTLRDGRELQFWTNARLVESLPVQS